MKSKAEMNIETGKRIDILLKKYQVTQLALSEKVNVSPQQINRLVNGKCSLTRYMAEAIANTLPPTRTSWLLCETEYMNDEDERKQKTKQALEDAEESKKRLEALLFLAHLSGYEFMVPSIKASSVIEVGSKQCQTFSELINGFYSIKYGNGGNGVCSVQQAHLLALDIQELVAQRINSFLREADENGKA